MTGRIHRRSVLLTALLAAAALPSAVGIARAAERPLVRVGALPFGTVTWELAAIRARGLAADAGIRLNLLEVASPTAGQIALQSGAVDVIASDWIWVARQRAAGQDLTFAPYSTAVGAVVVPRASPVTDVAGLKGRRMGVAGGPLDKGWLLLKALARDRHGLDLDSAADIVYAAPPLLSQQLEAGRLDAVLTYWHYAARLEAKGARALIGVAEIARRLGVETDVPLLGYVFREDWARSNPAAVSGFITASRAAKRALAGDDALWGEIAPLMKAGDDATFERLRAGFRAGIPERWSEVERRGAATLFALLAELGGTELVGSATAIPPGTFWPAEWDDAA